MRNVLVNCGLALAAYRARPGSSDKREPARHAAELLVRRALHDLRQGRGPSDVAPESPLNLLLAALDYCDDAGVPHSDVIATVNSHARQALPARPTSAAGQDLHH